MRDFPVTRLTEWLAGAFERINQSLSPEMGALLKAAKEQETSEAGRHVLAMLGENLRAAKEEKRPICQDTGMAVVFLEVGQEVHFTGGSVEKAINEGVKKAYTDGFLRKSVVGDPFARVNTGDNTPAVIHTRLVPGDRVGITVTAKGFGSENTSRVFMLKPSDGRDGVIEAVVRAAREAGENACPPMVVGVGVGGTFEYCALMAKHALTREGEAENPEVRALEEEILQKINALGIGPAGLGGSVTALKVAVETFPTHIAGLPVAVNIGCHVNRHESAVL